MLFLIKFLVNLLIYILKYIVVGFVFLTFAILCLGIVIPITIIISTSKWMWKFERSAFDGGIEYIIYLYEELLDIHNLNKPKFKTWK